MKLTSEFDLHIEDAAKRISAVVRKTPLEFNSALSKRYGANVFVKREDLQVVRSYKLRGAYNMMASLDKSLLAKGVVCASAGNHAQGVAYSCNIMEIQGVIFMPRITPKQKIQQTKMFGNGHIEIVLVGDTFDDCANAAQEYTKEHDMTFIPPFDNKKIIEGQGTIALELLEDMKENPIDYVFVPIGGGGLCAGIASYMNDFSPLTKVIGAEPLGAASMQAAKANNSPIKIGNIDKFVDGAAVQKVGELNYAICSKAVTDVCSVAEGEVCSTILRLYNEDAIVAEPAGALSIAALAHYTDAIKGKNVICILSGSNNDINRMPEIKERSLIFEGLKHYFMVSLPQRANALRDFINNVMNEHVDIVRFEYMKKNERETGPVLIGIELDNYSEYEKLCERMTDFGVEYTPLDPSGNIFKFIV